MPQQKISVSRREASNFIYFCISYDCTPLLKDRGRIMTQSIRWKPAPPPRAKPVDPTKWQEHKDKLCRLYETMTLEDLMVMMKIRYQFSPRKSSCRTRRQYVFQFDKWGLEKYKKTVDPIFMVPGSADQQWRLVENASKIRRQEFARDQANTSVGPEIGFGNSYAAPTSTAYREDEQMVGELDLPHILDDRTSSDEREQLLSMSDGSPKRPNITLDNTGAVSTPQDVEDLDLMDVDTLEACIGQTPSAILSTLVGFIDLDAPVDALGPDELSDIKFAADFLFATKCHEDAFGLYVLSLKRVIQGPEGREWMITSLVIGCARSSTTAAQAEIARHTLEEKLVSQTERLQDPLVSLLFNPLVADIHRDHGDMRAAGLHDRLSIQPSMTENLSSDQPACGKVNIGIVAYKYLTRNRPAVGFWKIQNVADQLVREVPGPFEYKNDHRWRRQEMLQNITLEWACQVEQTMGISPAELLVSVCSVMVDTRPTRTLLEHLEAEKVWYKDIPRRALRGGQIPDKLPEWELAHDFLNAYSIFSNSADDGQIDRSFKVLLQDYCKSWVQGSLSLQLQKLEPRASQSNLDFNPLRSTIGTSLHSSNFNSFRSLQARIQNGKGNTNEVFCQLPSGSMGSLSLPRLMNMAQCSMETLENISSQVREHVTELPLSLIISFRLFDMWVFN
ncbi:hypothetical protein BDZ45DRAFT_802637 [Acephala macrosclerotiorum]|nr:hypothetical protein BDZ45DRAFT_802637 [Acephala macrosclerotiorum]